ncbi:hypothetical protein RRG08_013265 [Elysia crispata]|uniref:Uncharacterized protein n=1 Tax=Elysia crispata TaxID=231223 RepID=A0AAE0ZAW9_9GAST|nr:hypothetical protein RRG08_013265 [Elysia crispata]
MKTTDRFNLDIGRSLALPQIMRRAAVPTLQEPVRQNNTNVLHSLQPTPEPTQEHSAKKRKTDHTSTKNRKDVTSVRRKKTKKQTKQKQINLQHLCKTHLSGTFGPHMSTLLLISFCDPFH